MQPPFHIGHAALVSSEKAFGPRLFALAVSLRGGSEDGGEVVLDGGEAVGVLDGGACRFIGDVSHAGKMGVMAPCMSFYNVAMEVAEGR